MLSYRGYDAEISYSDGDDSIHGSVINIADTIHFQGRSLDELKRSFEDSVDDYLAWCEEAGHTPAKPYSGTLLLRMEPELHRRAALSAGPRKLNAFIVAAIEHAVSSTDASPASGTARSRKAAAKRSTVVGTKVAATTSSAPRPKAAKAPASTADAAATANAKPRSVRSKKTSPSMASRRGVAKALRVDASE